MFKTNARTKTAASLAAEGNRLRLETPQFMAQCLTDRVPYGMPDPAGGYVILAEYGDPCPMPEPPEKPNGCGCGSGCAEPSKCQKKPRPEKKCEQPNRAGLERDDEDRLLRYEIAEYSGYEADGVTLILTQRGVEGTIKQDWPVNTLVMQVMTGAELKDVYSSINGVKSFLDSLGCILAVPRNPDGACGGWNVGEWACFGGQFYRSKENGNCTTAPGAKWDCGLDLFDLLDLYCNGLVDCAGDKISWTDKVVACRNMGTGLYWNETTKKWEVGGNKDCAGDAIAPSDRVVACRNMGAGLVWNAITKKWDVSTVRIIAIDDSGTQTTITLSDGTVISGPEIDKDDYVVSYVKTTNAAGESILTITMKSGATHQVTLPGAVASSVTDLTNTSNYEAGTIQINSSDGADTVLDITNPNIWPSAWIRAGAFATEGVSGLKPPGQGIIQDELSGGFSYDADGNLVIPKTGRWDTHFLVASIAQETKLYTGNQQLKISLLVNGVAVAARQQDDYTGNHSGEESARPRLPILILNKGDKISVETTEESPENRMVSYDIKLIFISSV